MIFDHPEAYRRAFDEGLIRLLDSDSPGAFILVLANAGFDPAIWERLHARLRERLELWRRRYRACLAEGGEPPGAPDDVAVMLRLLVLGFDHLATTEFRQVGDWEAQFNPLRAFRPKRMAGQRVNALHKPFDADGFHFDKPFLRDETFWSGALGGREVRLLYNKFPFVEQHGLLVPEPGARHPQWLRAGDHHWLFSLCAGIGAGLPGFCVGYNAHGAHASVNHLHFQTCVRERSLPVCAAHWRHNGGEREYPGECHRFDEADSAWRFIDGLHHLGMAYNLLYVPGACYCLPRRMQGSRPDPAWSSGFAWYETCGGFTTFRRADFLALDEASIEQALRELRSGMAWTRSGVRNLGPDAMRVSGPSAPPSGR